MAVQYGVTPCGRWFIDALADYNLGARFDRGKSYANTGKVLELKITGQRASAKVKGHYSPYYRVEIDFPLMAEADQAKVKAVIEKNPALLARLSAGELPESFLVELRRQGVALIPKRWQDMKKKCSCPDSGGYSTCKHIAALYFVLSRAVDADPNALFMLRGIDLRGLAEKSGAALDFHLPEPLAITTRNTKNTKKINDDTKNYDAKTEDMPDDDSANGNSSNEISLNAIPHCAAFITSLLPPRPSFCSERDFSVVLNEFYHHAAHYRVWMFGDVTEETERAFSRSHWSMEYKPDAPLTSIKLTQTDIHGTVTRHDVYDIFQIFREHSNGGGTANYRFLFFLFKFIDLVIASGAFIPCPLLKNNRLEIVWLVFDGLPELKNTADDICRLEDRMLKLTGKNVYADGYSVFKLISSAVLSEYVKRGAFSSAGGSQEFKELCAMFFAGTSLDVSAPARRPIPQAIGRCLTVLYTDFLAYRYRIVLKEPSRKRGGADGADVFSLSMDVMLDGKNIPLKDAAKKTGGVDVLKAPAALSNYLSEIQQLLERPSVILDEERLVAFLDEASFLLARLGIEIILPKTLHRELKPRLALNVEQNRSGGSLVSYLDIPSLLDFEWRVAIGDTLLSAAEFNALLKQKKQVVKFKDKFIRLDPDELERLFKSTLPKQGKRSDESPDKPPNEPVGANDFLKAYFSGNAVLSAEAQKLLEKIFEKKDFPPPAGLRAELRPYQLRGYNWALSLMYAGFGCVIADDMGLGKTIQAIAVLLRLKTEGFFDNGCLVVAPAALLENWERELRRFAPDVAVCRYHGKDRVLADGADVFLTTYQTAVRDKAKLCAQTFSLLVVDEAHLMKNAETRGAKTIKELQARFKLALSGTPVENRLEDMRSLFDFILPGYLGGAAQFRDEFRRPIEIMRDKKSAERLRSITAPFLLRRVKTDKSIISDLPDKITSNEYAALEKEQAALYESVVRLVMEKLEKADEAPARQALILQLLTSLKQICDHPRVYDKESPAVSPLSGKAMLLLTLLDEILGGGEKALIFSQYVETLECLSTIIRNEAGEAPLIYHGGLSQSKRAAAVDAFQNDGGVNILLVSLRAGGLGLNLTAASRVIHYDLWYNPAVEAQATDRAFRIGQKRNVFVHRFITKNSFEEKIDAMLQSKKELAGMTVGSGESWLSSMSQTELRALFSR
ncbi:MAG: DEAD/DEAH box helicase [Spirochaetaceae bacterium]|jgi:SNF2 family DNA or RNA helicase/uncharacterized Zn finger protein|nr:DEAD/DEAH box helicase [Spirochaetaceae bacterium]